MKKSLNSVIAGNLAYLMSRPGCPYPNPNALAGAASIASNTVRNILNPKQRPTTLEKVEGYPTLDKLESIAGALGCEVWELLHPDIEQARRERSLYLKFEQEFNSRGSSDEPKAAQSTTLTYRNDQPIDGGPKNKTPAEGKNNASKGNKAA